MTAFALIGEAGASTCLAKYTEYVSAQSLQRSTAAQLGTLVFDELQRHNCPVVGLNLLDYYISVLEQAIAAKKAAFPCSDSTRNTREDEAGKYEPQEILAKARQLRPICLQYLNNQNALKSGGLPPATMDQLRRSQNCGGSDVTGTLSDGTQLKPTQKQTDCRDAQRELNLARKFRKEYPALANEQYKKAAEAHKKAGEPKMAEAILWEMSVPKIGYPNETPEQLERLREAASGQNNGRGIERANPKDCTGDRETALSHYARAVENFKKAGEIEQSNVNVRDYNRLTRELNEQCRRGKAPTPPPGGKTGNNSGDKNGDKPPPPPDDPCKKALEPVVELEKLADFLDSMTTAGTVNPDAQKHRADAKKRRDELAAKGCK